MTAGFKRLPRKADCCPMTLTHAQAGWEETCRKYSFVERANELDKVVDEAKRAMARGDEPRNLYQWVAPFPRNGNILL